jgi:meiotically up-regulated gene 157 (Mug157) protein
MSACVPQRPPEAQRNFASDSVESLIENVSVSIAAPELAWLFENCLPNTALR